MKFTKCLQKNLLRKQPQEHILEGDGLNKLEYTVEAGPFPVSYHRGIVEFRDAANG
jgi:hypothetical protein